MVVYIDFNRPLTSFDGREIAIAIDAAGKETLATLKWAAVEALMHNGKEPLSASQHIERYMLASEIHKATDAVGLTIENIALIRGLIPLRFEHPVIAAPALLAIDASPKTHSSNDQN